MNGKDYRRADAITGYLDEDGVERAPFRTPDGVEHKTWNEARRHLTGLDLLATIRKAGPDLFSIRDAILREWNISLRSAPEARAEGAPRAGRDGDHNQGDDK